MIHEAIGARSEVVRVASAFLFLSSMLESCILIEKFSFWLPSPNRISLISTQKEAYLTIHTICRNKDSSCMLHPLLQKKLPHNILSILYNFE